MVSPWRWQPCRMGCVGLRRLSPTPRCSWRRLRLVQATGMRRKNPIAASRGLPCGQSIRKAPHLPKPALVGCCLLLPGVPRGQGQRRAVGGDFGPPVLRWLLWFFSSDPETLFLASMVPHSSSRVGSAAGRGAGNGSPHPALGKPSRLAKT